jgi:predicted transcriptional regulator of viral defense system
MTDILKVKRMLSLGDGMFTASSAEKAGIHRQKLANFVKAGIIERTARGIYCRPGELVDTLFCIQQSAKKIVYSHETALFLHRMTGRTPIRYSITVPSSYKASATLRSSCKIYYIKQDLVNIGKTSKQSGMGHEINTYNLERTLCDIIRSRNKIDSQIVIEAVKNYAKYKGKDLHILYKYAKKFRIEKILHHYLEVLL